MNDTSVAPPATARAYAEPHRPLAGILTPAVPAAGAEDLEPFGVHVGPRVHHARRFRHVTLPTGWTLRGDTYGMPSALYDQYDRRRALLRWDRFDPSGPTGHTLVLDVANYVLFLVERPDDAQPLAFDDRWATKSAVIAVATARLATLRHLIGLIDADLARWGDDHPGTTWREDRESLQRRCHVYEALLIICAAAPDRPGPVAFCGTPASDAAVRHRIPSVDTPAFGPERKRKPRP